MAFAIYLHPAAQAALDKLRASKGSKVQLKAVEKALRLLAANPKHQGLNTHKWQGEECPHGEALFEAYAQNRTPGAYRIWFCYGKKGEVDRIHVIQIGPHP